MNSEVPKHRRVRFRQRDIRRLETLPSSQGQDLHPAVAAPRRSLFRRLAWGGGVFLLVFLAFVGVLFFSLKSGLEGEQLTARARFALQDLVGDRVTADLANAQVGLDPQRFVTVDVNDVRFSDAVAGLEIGAIDEIRLGLAPMALLTGNLEVDSVAIDGVRIVANTGDAEERGLPASIVDETGLIATDRVLETVFELVGQVLQAFDEKATRRVNLSDLRIAGLPGDQSNSTGIEDLHIERKKDGTITLSGRLNVFGTVAPVEGKIIRHAADKLAFDLKVDQAQVSLPVIVLDKITGVPLLPEQAEASLRFSGTGSTKTGGSLTAALRIASDDPLDDGAHKEILAGRFELVTGSEKLEISKLRLALGRNVFDLEGAIAPQIAPTDSNAYRFNLISNELILAPQDSPEPAVVAAVRVAGTFDRTGRNIQADQFTLRTKGGEIVGQGQAYLPKDLAPAAFLAIRVSELPVAHAKQIWPSFAAAIARNWVLDNVFGGMVRNSRLELSVGPGRFGSGVPLTADEVSGHFEVTDTRFDVVGDIPPVRDAYGSIDFQGTDVDIALISGTAFMPGERTVEASAGTFTIRKAEIWPVVAQLEIDVAGSADAIAELSDHEPINALRHVDIRPDDLSGSVNGHVSAEIPLSRERPDRELGWHVRLRYDQLNLARAIEGQKIDNAVGTIDLVPDMAVITAKADLNGISSEIELHEPLGNGDGKRMRDIALVFDDKARSKVAPGLNALLKGPVKVKLGGVGDETRRVSADLTDAEISIPWLGWSKGKGISAQAHFNLVQKASQTEISEFVLDGKSFGMKGGFTISGGKLVKADLNNVQLNREDKFNVTIRQKSGVYDLAFTGSSMDLRPVIKKYRPYGASGGKLDLGAPIRLSADIDRVTGFNGRQHKDLRLKLQGHGATIESLDAASVTGTGAPIVASYRLEGRDASISLKTGDAGAVLGFLDIYKRMKGGQATLVLASNNDGPLTGAVDVREFWMVNEPRLGSITTTRAPNGDGRSLNEVLPAQIDTGKVKFNRGYALIDKGKDHLSVRNGKVSGPTVGATFDGNIYDSRGEMALNGTFMPAYGLNSALSNIPVLGFVLGNGRDRGLIGVTFRLTGDPGAPNVQINPLSVIAPGIFRSIFEFRQ